MSELMPTENDPNVSAHTGPDRIFHCAFAAGTIFRRRGGKAVDKHHYYQAATAASSNLAGFAEVEEVGVANGKPVTVNAGDELPVNHSLEKAFVFPTTGRAATVADIGKDFDIYVDPNGIQMVNLGASKLGVLRISQIVTRDAMWVAVQVPPDLRYGNR